MNTVEPNVRSVWSKACKHLGGVLSKDVFERWIAVIHPRELNESQLTLSVANEFYQCWLEENYITLIRDAVAAETGQSVKISFVVDPAAAAVRSAAKPDPAAEAAPLAPAAPAISSRQSGSPLNTKYTFETFVVGPSNNFAHAASFAVAQAPAKAYNPLFIYGGSGLGKTHLMQAIGQSILSRVKLRVTYLRCEAFTNEYIAALQNKNVHKFREKYRGTDVLLIDDIHFLTGKTGMQEEFFHTFNTLFDSHKQIVLTCDRPASEVQGLEHRLVSRFEWGLTVDLEIPDVETRIAILRKKQEQLHTGLPDEIVVFIAERIRSNIRRLEGALIRAAGFASLSGNKLSIAEVEHVLRDTLNDEVQDVMTMEKIQKAVVEHFDLRMADMTSKRRPESVALPRQIAMYLSRTLTAHSLPVIGNAFGKNHATVLHACRIVGDRMKQDPEFRRTIALLEKKLGQ